MTKFVPHVSARESFLALEKETDKRGIRDRLMSVGGGNCVTARKKNEKSHEQPNLRLIRNMIFLFIFFLMNEPLNFQLNKIYFSIFCSLIFKCKSSFSLVRIFGSPICSSTLPGRISRFGCVVVALRRLLLVLFVNIKREMPSLCATF